MSNEEKKVKTWKQVSDERRERGISRRLRISRGEGKRGGLLPSRSMKKRLDIMRGEG